MKTLAMLALVVATGAAGAPNVDKPFVSGGSINMQLESGEYDIVPAADNHIRVTLGGNVGNTVAEVTAANRRADIRVRNTPNHGNFHATIEVPKNADLVVRFTAGDLNVGAIIGNKDIEANAGDVKIDVPKSDDYASVDASVRIGDLSAGPFGGKKEGLIGQSLNWAGKGKYKLRARLGAGDLKLQ
jgi:DUF4097 and DUF4098 domain-containing protein YvlB